MRAASRVRRRMQTSNSDPFCSITAIDLVTQVNRTFASIGALPSLSRKERRGSDNTAAHARCLHSGLPLRRPSAFAQRISAIVSRRIMSPCVAVLRGLGSELRGLPTLNSVGWLRGNQSRRRPSMMMRLFIHSWQRDRVFWGCRRLSPLPMGRRHRGMNVERGSQTVDPLSPAPRPEI
jgi:hypothetical protein